MIVAVTVADTTAVQHHGVVEHGQAVVVEADGAEIHRIWGEDLPKSWAVVAGETATLTVSVTDARGWELGWNAEDLVIEASGAASVWMEEGALKLSADGEPGDVASFSMSLFGQTLGTWDVPLIDAGDVHHWTLQETAIRDWQGGQQPVLWVDARTDDGTAVLGCAPEWSWSGQQSTSDALNDVVAVPEGVHEVEVTFAGRQEIWKD